MMPRLGRNGTFAEARTGLVKTNHLIVALLAVSCVGLSVVWFLFVSKYWQVSRIETNALTGLSREEVASSTYDILDHGAWKPWDKRNIFFVDPKNVASQLRDRLFAEDVIVDKVYPNVLRLLIQERQRSVVFVSQSQLLVVDTNGIVTGEATDGVASDTRALIGGKAVADPTHIPVIVNVLSELATAGYQVARPEDVRVWIEGYKSLTTKGMRFRYLKLDDTASQTVHIAMEAGYDVIMDLTSPLEPQIDTYKKFAQTKTKDDVIHEYVDVRVPGKVFLK